MTDGQLVRAAFIARVHGLRGAQHRRDLFLRLIRVYPQGSQHIAIQETPPPVFIIPSKDICFKYFYDNEGGRSIREVRRPLRRLCPRLPPRHAPGGGRPLAAGGRHMTAPKTWRPAKWRGVRALRKPTNAKIALIYRKSEAIFASCVSGPAVCGHLRPCKLP